MEQGRFGTHENLQALIENWSLKIGHWPLNSAVPAAQWPFMNFQRPSGMRLPSAGSIMFDPRLQPPAAVSRSQAPGNPFREACNLSKNKCLTVGLYHDSVVVQNIFAFFLKGRRLARKVLHERVETSSPRSTAGKRDSIRGGRPCTQNTDDV